jgi:hypothetical protein
MSCRVVVGCRHPRHLQGNFQVRVDLRQGGPSLIGGRNALPNRRVLGSGFERESARWPASLISPASASAAARASRVAAPPQRVVISRAKGAREAGLSSLGRLL